jgi:transposase-like protein
MARFSYCPRCGVAFHVKGFVRRGESLMCKTCRHTVDRLLVSRLKLERARLVVAALHLVGTGGYFTRREIADHLGVTKSPALRVAVDALADLPAFQRAWMCHPQNGCPTWFYSRKGVQ